MARRSNFSFERSQRERDKAALGYETARIDRLRKAGTVG